jgi:hypothetical protein
MFTNTEKLYLTPDINGYDDAGKLGQRGLMYSELTTDKVTREAYDYDENQLKPPPQAYKGVNTWRTGFDQGMKYYKLQYQPLPGENENLPNYPKVYTATGEFKESEPLASNTPQLN